MAQLWLNSGSILAQFWFKSGSNLAQIWLKFEPRRAWKMIVQNDSANFLPYHFALSFSRSWLDVWLDSGTILVQIRLKFGPKMAQLAQLWLKSGSNMAQWQFRRGSNWFNWFKWKTVVQRIWHDRGGSEAHMAMKNRFEPGIGSREPIPWFTSVLIWTRFWFTPALRPEVLSSLVLGRVNQSCSMVQP